MEFTEGNTVFVSVDFEGETLIEDLLVILAI